MTDQVRYGGWTRAQMGLREVDTGDTEPKVPPGFTEGADIVRIRNGEHTRQVLSSHGSYHHGPA